MSKKVSFNPLVEVFDYNPDQPPSLTTQSSTYVKTSSTRASEKVESPEGYIVKIDAEGEIEFHDKKNKDKSLNNKIGKFTKKILDSREGQCCTIS